MTVDYSIRCFARNTRPDRVAELEDRGPKSLPSGLLSLSLSTSLSLSLYIYIYIYIYIVYVYIYIYVMCIYIYIYIYVMCIYTYIHIYIERERERHTYISLSLSLSTLSLLLLSMSRMIITRAACAACWRSYDPPSCTVCKDSSTSSNWMSSSPTEFQQQVCRMCRMR